MQIVDLSHTLESNMPVYPGTETPNIQAATSIASHGFKETLLHIFSHVGTHTDTPAHLYENAESCDTISLEKYYGEAQKIDCSQIKAGELIEKTFLQEHIKPETSSKIIILQTNWSKYWKKKAYFENYPVLSSDAAIFLVECKINLIGIDAISVDEIQSETLPIHRILLSAGICIVENLTNLRNIPNANFTFSAFPLKIIEGDGSPVRAVAILKF